MLWFLLLLLILLAFAPGPWGNPSSRTTLEEAEIPSPTRHSPSVRGKNPPWFFWVLELVAAFFFFIERILTAWLTLGKRCLANRELGVPLELRGQSKHPPCAQDLFKGLCLHIVFFSFCVSFKRGEIGLNCLFPTGARIWDKDQPML